MENNKETIKKNSNIVVGYMTLISMILIAVFAFASCNKNDDTSKAYNSANNFKNGMSITLTQALPACTTSENLSKLDDAMLQKNEDLKNSMINSGEAIGISSGEKIDIIDVGTFKTKIQYNSIEYYVHTEMISD